MTISQYGVLTSALVAAAIIGRIAFLFLRRIPLRGRLGHRNYGGLEERMERDAMKWTLGDGTLWGHPTDSIPVRDVCARAHYSYDGADYSNDVTVTVVKGWGPKDDMLLWIDPVDPDNVTARGPGYWFCWLVLAGTFLVAFSQLPF